MNGIFHAPLFRFAAIGVIGFAVDTGALYFAIHLLGAGLYFGRAFSYALAATSTWALNRRVTFHARRSANRVAEWARFFAANAVGGLINYGVYAFLVSSFDTAARWPVIAVGAGSLAGLAINFNLSRRVVFTGG